MIDLMYKPNWPQVPIRSGLPGKTHRVRALAWGGLCAALMCGHVALAGNLLVNPSFEANSGNVVPSAWTYFMPPNGSGASYWCDTAGSHAHSGNLYWKQWGIYWDAARTNVAGIYQQFNSAPNATYNASGWFYTLSTDVMGPNNIAWLEVSFRNSSGQVLALYKSDNFSAATGADAWYNLPVTNACDLGQPIPSGDTNSAYYYYAVTGAVTTLTAPPGTAFVRYQFAMVQGGGWPEGGGSVYFDDAVLNQLTGPVPPVIGNVSPPNPSMFINPADGISFTASSASGTTINNSGIHMSLNGQDVTAGLNIIGTASAKTVTYSGLQSNTAYTVSITVTDAFNFSASAGTYFETTWVNTQPVVYLWEAEDWDFTNGTYVNFPALCSTPDNPNCYFGKVGVQGVDENNTVVDGDHLYRPDDGLATTGSGDLMRPNLTAAGRLDYKVGWFEGGEWANYTRDWPAGNYWVIARLANGGGAGTLTLSRVSATATNDLGTFNIVNGRGWTAYDTYYLKDTNGNNVEVTLNGKETLRATTGGNVDMGFFALVTPMLDAPVLSNLYPSGTHPFEPTNTLSFQATAAGSTIPAAGIKVTLDGVDVTSSLSISPPGQTVSVVYSGLPFNSVHTAIITVTNALGHGIRVVDNFDTFSQTNYMVEAEDFDYNGGAFFANPAVWDYLGKDGVAGIDFSHATVSGEQFTFRGVGLPTQASSDYVRQKFLDMPGTVDYNLGWFGYPDWGNYTRDYPAGNYRVYGRFAGNGGYSMYLDHVLSGTGTVNQVTQRLGRWGAVGRDWQTYDWVPLTDEGLAYPIVVSLGGVTTLRISTTGNCNPNYLMLVPESGIQVASAHSGNNLVLSIPTQAGLIYRVFTRTDLSAGNWTLLTTVTGDGSVKTVNDTISGSQRFYRVVAP